VSLRRILLLAVLLVSSCRVHSAPPAHPDPAIVAGWTATCEAIWREELYRDVHDDAAGLASCLERARRGLDAAAIRADVQASAEWREKHGPCPAGERREQGRCVAWLLPLSVDGPIFRTADGTPWVWRGVSAFPHVDAVLDAFAGYNVVRVWLYVTWPGSGWPDVPNVETIRAFLTHCAERRWYVELTLLTDDDPSRLAPMRRLVAELASAPRPPNLLIEIGNEPTTHKRIDTAALRDVLEASGFLYSSGDYEDSARWFGRYLTAHTGRDREWPRRAHDLLEYFTGGGPGAPTDPAHRVSIVADEPIRPDEAPGDLEAKRRDYLAYGAACALLGAGATFHSTSGKWAQLPTDEERLMAMALLEGLTAFPAGSRLGAYRRIDEHGRSLRTYAVGEFMVRIRPTTVEAPESGWAPIDASGITWRRRGSARPFIRGASRESTASSGDRIDSAGHPGRVGRVLRIERVLDPGRREHVRRGRRRIPAGRRLVSVAEVQDARHNPARPRPTGRVFG
jgi:hypothetical protein